MPDFRVYFDDAEGSTRIVQAPGPRSGSHRSPAPLLPPHPQDQARPGTVQPTHRAPRLTRRELKETAIALPRNRDPAARRSLRRRACQPDRRPRAPLAARPRHHAGRVARKMADDMLDIAAVKEVWRMTTSSCAAGPWNPSASTAKPPANWPMPRWSAPADACAEGPPSRAGRRRGPRLRSGRRFRSRERPRHYLSEALCSRIAQALVQERENCAFAAETHSGFGDAATIEACAQIIRTQSTPMVGPGLIHISEGRYLELLTCEEMAARLPPTPLPADEGPF